MSWLVFLLIAVLGYVTGFLLTGVAYSHLFNPNVTDRWDMFWAMLFWPVFFIPYMIGLGILNYILFLEKNRKERAMKLPKNVTKLPTKGGIVTLHDSGWETSE